jgi:hypothetical protein
LGFRIPDSTSSDIPALDLLSSKRGGFEQGGNLYVLAADSAWDSGSIYRFDVADTSGVNVGNTTVQAITEANGFLHFFAIGRFRDCVKTDGAFLFHCFTAASKLEPEKRVWLIA